MHETVSRLLEEDLELGVLEGGFTWPELCARLRLPKNTPPPDPSMKTAQLISGVAVTPLRPEGRHGLLSHARALITKEVSYVLT